MVRRKVELTNPCIDGRVAAQRAASSARDVDAEGTGHAKLVRQDRSPTRHIPIPGPFGTIDCVDSAISTWYSVDRELVSHRSSAGFPWTADNSRIVIAAPRLDTACALFFRESDYGEHSSPFGSNEFF